MGTSENIGALLGIGVLSVVADVGVLVLVVLMACWLFRVLVRSAVRIMRQEWQRPSVSRPGRDNGREV